MKSSFLFFLAMLPSLSYGAPTTAPVCEHTSDFVEKQLAGSTIAFQGRVKAVEREAGDTTPGTLPRTFVQDLTYQVLHSWNGPLKVGALVHVTVRVTEICAGFGCVFPFKTGDETLVLSPASAPFSAPMFLEGCWVHEDVVVSSILILASIPNK